jgi:hypothetical protein
MCFIYKIAHAIRRYVSLGNNLKTGNDIESSVKTLRGTSIAHLEPKRNIEKRVKTLAGVSDLYFWQWPISGEYSGFICGRVLPNVGDWVNFSPAQINGLVKQKINKPEPTCTSHSIPKEKWNIPTPDILGKYNNYLKHYKILLIKIIFDKLQEKKEKEMKKKCQKRSH